MSKPGPIAVTVIGTDRPGIVAGVTRALYEAGCNLEDVTSTILRGHFSMVMVVRGPEGADAARLEDALAPAAREMDLVVAARPVEEASIALEDSTHVVSVYGADHPGIVYRVADALAGLGANVTDLTSRLIGSPDEPVYALMLEISAPSPDEVAAALDELRGDVGVEVSMHPIERDVL
ncbi:MAG TPA: ACT domain-containing protein [Actinomycetota bacterium]|nr:ACT domain-containing protein [Actinomycetota bacterium]